MRRAIAFRSCIHDANTIGGGAPDHVDPRRRRTNDRSCSSATTGPDALPSTSAMKTILETKRLLLREMTEADADHLFALNENPNVTRYIPGEPPLKTRDDALEVLRVRVFPQYARGLGRWACIVKASGDFIGWSGVKHVAEDGEYDIGYRFVEHAWGHGYATEAARAVLAFAREHLAGERVVGKAMVENVASRRVLEKIGLVYEGIADDDGCEVAVYVMR
jgi:RimJ/RimL family protein N-acetyltransferase